MANSTVGMPKDELMGFTVFKPTENLVKATKKEIYLTLTVSGVRFSLKAVEAMGSPESVVVLFDQRDRMLVIPSSTSEPNSIPLDWGGSRKDYHNGTKKVGLKTELLGRMCPDNSKLPPRGSFRCSGRRANNYEDNALIFDLTEAERVRK